MALNKKKIRSMAEEDLCQGVLIPLFEAMGYRDVYYHHGGTLEQGKDLVMWKEEPLKGRVNYAVVVKAKKISGAASQGMHEVLMQIKQCLGSTFIDKQTHDLHQVHQCFLVTSHEIKKEGDNSFRRLLEHDNLLGRVFTIDGEHLWALISEHLPSRAALAQIESAYRSLESPHPDYSVNISMKPGEQHLELAPKHPDAEPISVSFSPNFPDTPAGRKKKRQFQKYVKSGARVELTHENLPVNRLPEPLRDLFPFSEGEPFTLVMGPSSFKHPIPMVLTAEGDDGESFALPMIEFTEIQRGIESTTLTNDDQPIPLRVRFFCSTHDNRVAVNYSFQFAGQSIYWVVQACHFHKILAVGAKLVLRNMNTGLALPAFKIPPGSAKDWGEPFLSVAQEFLDLQDLLEKPILAPNRSYFSDHDLRQVSLIRRIITTGTLPGGIESVNVAFKNQDGFAGKLLDLFAGEIGPELKFRKSEHFEKLLDQDVSLGPLEARIRGARVHPTDLAKLKRCAAGKVHLDELPLKLLAEEGQKIEVSFPSWPKPDAEPLVSLREDETLANRPTTRSSTDRRSKASRKGSQGQLRV